MNTGRAPKGALFVRRLPRSGDVDYNSHHHLLGLGTKFSVRVDLPPDLASKVEGWSHCGSNKANIAPITA